MWDKHYNLPSSDCGKTQGNISREEGEGATTESEDKQPGSLGGRRGRSRNKDMRNGETGVKQPDTPLHAANSICPQGKYIPNCSLRRYIPYVLTEVSKKGLPAIRVMPKQRLEAIQRSSCYLYVNAPQKWGSTGVCARVCAQHILSTFPMPPHECVFVFLVTLKLDAAKFPGALDKNANSYTLPIFRDCDVVNT